MASKNLKTAERRAKEHLKAYQKAQQRLTGITADQQLAKDPEYKKLLALDVELREKLHRVRLNVQRFDNAAKTLEAKLKAKRAEHKETEALLEVYEAEQIKVREEMEQMKSSKTIEVAAANGLPVIEAAPVPKPSKK